MANTVLVQLRYGTVSVWEDGKIARITNYTDIDEARAAELAKSLGCCHTLPHGVGLFL